MSYKILDAEKISYDEETVKKIVQNTQRDIRQLIIQLEYYFTNKNNEALCLQKMKKEIEYTHFESAEKILRKYHKIANTRQITDANFNIVSMIFFENFLNDILKNKKGKKEDKIKVIECIYNSFVDGDMMDKEIFVKQHWILHDYASVDKCSRPSFLLK